MKVWRLGTVAGMIVGAGLISVHTQGQPQSQRYSGSGDYQVYCSSCHGTGARGDGVIAKSLKKQPADLTQLSKHNEGVFPEKQVFTTIDARELSGPHSESVMPAWREVFAKSSESLGQEKAVARINALVAYLQTLQVK